MNCPVCKKNTFQNKKLDSGMLVSECSECGGYWIKSFQFWQWIHAEGQAETARPLSNGEDENLDSHDTKYAKICPECGKFLHRYEVGKGVDFAIDRCNTCGGIWFDKNEWEILEQKGMHTDINKIFSAAWQNEIRQDQKSRQRDQHLEKLLGDDDFTKLKDFKAWYDQNKNKSQIIAYLKGMSR